jgi:hypothetical protein
MDQQRQLIRQNPGPGSDPGETPDLYSASAGGTLQAVQGWESIANDAAGECEGTSRSTRSAEEELQRRAQRSAQ